jgi:hypothetical protein
MLCAHETSIIPGATHSYELVTVTPSAVEIDTNGGSCYSVKIPPA